MGRVSSLAAVIVVAAGACAAPFPPAGGADSEDVVARHMVAEALLAAHLVAVAERAGMSPEGINTILKDVVARSAIDEFWITDESGRAYLTSEDVEFTFVDDPQEQPQASAFWPLITGEAEVVIQEPRRREIDEQVFRYVGVAGVDRPRIVQVGVSAEGRPAPD
jgi:hypothetical protein